MPELPQRSQKIETLRLLDEKARRKAGRKLESFYPDEGPLSRDKYPKHIGFFAIGKTVSQRCVMAANRVGKTEGIGGPEVTYHLTGQYPVWWDGRRFDRLITAWASGTTNKKTQEIIQEKLLGKSDKIGTGLIPADNIVRTAPKPGLPDAVSAIYVKHYTDGVFDGVSVLVLKSYEMGREAFEGNEVDVIWLDEEPPASVYFECQTRTMSTVLGQDNGLLLCTFTPLEGLSETALLFAPSGAIVDGVNPETGRYTLNLTWDDAPHLSEKAKAELLASYPPYMRDARSKGIPQLGSGAIYPVPESEITVDDFPIPDHWPRAYALDVGWNFTAALWICKNPDTGQAYFYSEYKKEKAEPSIHAAGIKARGEWIKGAIDPAARGRSQHDGSQLIQKYMELGLHVIPAENSVESGLYSVWEMLSNGQLKVFKSLLEFLKEYRVYRRDDKGGVVKVNDHLMDAGRYAVISGLLIAICKPPSKKSFHIPQSSGGFQWA